MLLGLELVGLSKPLGIENDTPSGEFYPFQFDVAFYTQSELSRIRQFLRSLYNDACPQARRKIIDDIQQEFGYMFTIDDNGNSFLHFITLYCDLDTIAYTLKTYANDAVLPFNNDFETPLSVAIQHNRKSVISLIRDSLQDKSLYPPVISQDIVCTQPDLDDLLDELEIVFCESTSDFQYDEAIKRLNSKGLGLFSVIDSKGNTLFHYMAEYSSLTAISQVLKRAPRASIDCKNDLGQTPLMLALIANRRVIASAFVAHGANLRHLDKFGVSCTIYARRNGISYIKSYSSRFFLDAMSILRNSERSCSQAEGVQKLTSLGINIDEPLFDNDNSILHWLVFNAPLHVIQAVLLKYPNANIHALNRAGEMPIVIAAKQGRQQVIKLLIAHGADPHLISPTGESAVKYKDKHTLPLTFESTASPQKTVFSAFRERLLPCLFYFDKTSEFSRVMFIFNQFIRFARENGWQYQGVVDKHGDRVFLSDMPIGERYLVNCYDLAFTFAQVLRSFGISPLECYEYNNYKSLALNKPQTRIYGELSCFDYQAHKRLTNKSPHFEFMHHCVVYAAGYYFDPTFCCYYSDPKDILFSENPQETEKENDQLLINSASLLFGSRVGRAALTKSTSCLNKENCNSNIPMIKDGLISKRLAVSTS